MSNHRSAMELDQALAKKAGEFLIGGELRVTRLGFGAMRITGDGIWGEPANRAEAVRVLQRAVELGINFIDHCGLLRPGSERRDHRRGFVPISGRLGHRHQGRLCAHRSQPLG